MKGKRKGRSAGCDDEWRRRAGWRCTFLLARTTGSGARRPGRKDPRHNDESLDSLYAVAPAADRRIVLPRDAALLREHDVGEAGDVGDSRMVGRADPAAAFLLAEPDMLIEDAKQPVRTAARGFDVEIVE